jgi:hypothetical protein
VIPGNSNSNKKQLEEIEHRHTVCLYHCPLAIILLSTMPTKASQAASSAEVSSSSMIFLDCIQELFLLV